MAVRDVKVCLLGESGVGKSSIVHRFVHDTFNPAMPITIGASFLTKTINVDEQVFKYQIWDTAGQEKYRALAPMYYRGAATAVIVYDITKESTFGTLKYWVSELNKHGPPNIVLAIAGNKCDLEDLREVQFRDASAYADSVGAIFVETSAKSAVNIAAMFMAISRKLPAVGEAPPSNSPQRGRHLGKSVKDKKTNKKCCSS